MNIYEINETYKNIRIDVEKKIGGDYRLMMNGIIIDDDSACEDHYGCYEDVYDYFDLYVNDASNAVWPTINAAFGLGFHHSDFDHKESGFASIEDDVYVQCEEYIRKNGEAKFEQCDLNCSNRGQSYVYGYNNASGQIFDFANYKADKEVYFRKDGDKFTPVNWFDIPSEGKERHDFVFVFDTIVCIETGELIKLYDYFD